MGFEYVDDKDMMEIDETIGAEENTEPNNTDEAVQDKIILKHFRKLAMRSVIVSTVMGLLKELLSYSPFQTLINLIAAALPGFLAVRYDTDTNQPFPNWGFIIPFVIIYFALLYIFHRLNQKNAQTVRKTKLLQSINNSVNEISVLQHTEILKKDNTETLDIVSQAVCRAIHDIICDQFKLRSVKVTVVKRCKDERMIKLCAFYGNGENVPDAYNNEISLKGALPKNAKSYVKIFKNNLEDPLILKNEKECKAQLTPNGKKAINTKQFISLPGIVNEQVVILLQIASKTPDAFKDDDFTLIASEITPTFLQILCNTHMIERLSK